MRNVLTSVRYCLYISAVILCKQILLFWMQLIVINLLAALGYILNIFIYNINYMNIKIYM